MIESWKVKPICCIIFTSILFEVKKSYEIISIFNLSAFHFKAVVCSKIIKKVQLKEIYSIKDSEKQHEAYAKFQFEEFLFNCTNQLTALFFEN